jgi:hypothetical protein
MKFFMIFWNYTQLQYKYKLFDKSLSCGKSNNSIDRKAGEKNQCHYFDNIGRTWTRSVTISWGRSLTVVSAKKNIK